MNDLLTRILADAAIMTALAAIVGFLIKKWLSSAIEHHYSRVLEKEKSFLEIEKTKELNLLQTRNAIYPEMVELIYRLRNQFRDNLKALPQDSLHPTNWFFNRHLGEELYLLTEHLYKYRALIDEEIFNMLHLAKRSLQDAEVIFDNINRPIKELAYLEAASPDSLEDILEKGKAEFAQRYAESIRRLDELYQQVDEIYPMIVQAVRKHMKSILTRKPDAA